MPHQRQKLGQAGELAAARYLIGQGYKIVCQNWHAGRYGEIDIVAELGGEVVVIEVKTRRQTKFGYPEEAVNQEKLFKLRSAVQAFKLAHPQLGASYRIEVLALLVDQAGEVVDIKHYKNIYFEG